MSKHVHPRPEGLNHFVEREAPAFATNRINIKLSFEDPKDIERQVAALNLDKADVEHLLQLAPKSAALRKKLAEDPVAARDFAADPVGIVVREFPELELPVRKDRRLFDDRFRVRLDTPPVPADGALAVLHRTLMFVATSPANSDTFEADPLSTLRSVNAGQPEADVFSAELALEQVLGIYRIQRIPLDPTFIARRPR